MHIRLYRHELLPVEDYEVALEKAVQWLGDHYLLARPLHANQTASRSNHSRLHGPVVGLLSKAWPYESHVTSPNVANAVGRG